jgi:hypothetical protein
MSSILGVVRTFRSGLADRMIFLLSVALSLTLFCSPLFSQGSNGRILGAITDQSGGVVVGATVTIIDKDRGVARTLTTDDAGEYNAPNLIPGTYTVRADAKGFSRLDRENLEVGVGKEVRVDLTLQPGTQAQTVVVTESLPMIETTNATLGGTLESTQIQDLPLNGRNFQSLLGLRPGVMLQPGGGSFTQSTNNIRPDESVWMVDGVINENTYDGRPLAGVSSPISDGATILPIDAIQEFNLEENPKAEYGWRPGAVVNVGIKSGTNSLHGTAYAFGRSDAFNARNFFNVAETNGTCLPNPSLPAQCNKLSQQLEQFGATVGGPIKKDKLFFFGGYEGLRSNIQNAFGTQVPYTASQSVNASNCVTVTGDCAGSMVDAIRDLQANGITPNPVSLALLGCPSGTLTAASTCTGGLIANAPTNSTNYLSTFPNINQSDNGIGKIDYRINDKNQLTGTFFGAEYNGNGEDDPEVNPLFLSSVPIHSWTNVDNWIWTPNSRWVNDLRFSYQKFTYWYTLAAADAAKPVDGSGLTGGSGYPLNTGVTTTGGLPNIAIGSFGGNSPGHLLGAQRGPSVTGPGPFFDVQDDVSYLLGKHTLKFGGEYAHLEADSVAESRGKLNFTTGGVAIQGASTPLEDFFAGRTNTAPNPAGASVTTGGIQSRKYLDSSVAGFIQDDWRPTHKLIFNLGLRYSYQPPFTEANGQVGGWRPGVGLVQQGVNVKTLFNPDYKDFSPRVGFAWDVTGNGTTVVRGGASLIYTTFVVVNYLGSNGQQNNFGLSMATTPTGACNTNKRVPAGQTCAEFGGQTLLAGGNIANAGYNLSGATLSATSAIFPNVSTLVPNCGNSPFSSNRCGTLGVDANLKVPYVANWNLDIQHAFNRNLSLEVAYVANRGSRLIGFRDINQPTLGAGYCLNTPLTPEQIAGDCSGGPLPANSVSGFAELQARPFWDATAGSLQNQHLGVINVMANQSLSNYNSLQLTLTERAYHGLTFVAGYTYGHGLDDGSLNRYGMLPQNSQDVKAEYASSDFDIRHHFSFTTSYDIPGKKGYGQLLEGWKLNAIITIQSAQAWNVDDYTNDFSGTGETADRWDFFGNPSDFKDSSRTIPYCSFSGAPSVATATCVQTDGLYGQRISLPSSLAQKCLAVAPDMSTLQIGGCYVDGNSVLAPPTLGTFGTMGRNIFRDNGFKNVDFSVFKNFTFRERFAAQFRAEVFNLFNHPLVGNPYGASASITGQGTPMDISASNRFGCGCATPDVLAGSPIVSSGSSRVMQLGLKLTF